MGDLVWPPVCMESGAMQKPKGSKDLQAVPRSPFPTCSNSQFIFYLPTLTPHPATLNPLSLNR